MNLITIIVNALFHIILVLILEGIALFAIFFSIIDYQSKRYTQFINSMINDKINPSNPNISVNNKIILSNAKIVAKNLAFKTIFLAINNKNMTMQQQNSIWGDYYDSLLVSPLTDMQSSIIKSCVINEHKLIADNKYVPYIMYASLLIILILILIVGIFVSNKYNIIIDYKFIAINATIIFFLIGGFIGGFLWYSVFSQPYVLNVEKQMYEKCLEIYYNT